MPGIRPAVPLLIAVALARFAIAPSTLSATDYFVAPPGSGGSDANPGSSGAPWATLQKAVDTVGPGDRVTVRAGQYAAFEQTTSGSSGAPIVFAAAPGELVEIVTNLAVRGVGINLEGASWVTIEGFRIEGRTNAGIRAVLCDHVTLRGNRLVANGKWGILTGCCDDLLIEGNYTANSVAEHGIYVSNSGDRPTIRGNVSVGNNANGIHMNGDLSIDCDGSTAQDGVISDALVEGNTIVGNGSAGGSGINCDGVQDSWIRNNLIYEQHSSGISLYQIDGGAPSSGNRVEGNTVVVASDGRWGLNVQDDAEGTAVKNNLFFSHHSFRGAMDVCDTCFTGFVSDRNAVENRFTTDGGNSVLTLAEWQTDTGQDQNSIAIAGVDPAATLAALFVNSAVGNFHPVGGSALIDAGGTIADLLGDLESIERPQGLGHDIGAFEGADGLFSDGFEGGSTVRWSASTPPF